MALIAVKIDTIRVVDLGNDIFVPQNCAAPRKRPWAPYEMPRWTLRGRFVLWLHWTGFKKHLRPGQVYLSVEM